MAEPFIGEIRTFGFNYAPKNWALCNGASMDISQNTALFSILGTIYGGDGRQNFLLPDLQGRVPSHPGTGAGLTPVKLGEKSGTEGVTLTTGQIPNHTHDVQASSLNANSKDPASRILAKARTGTGPNASDVQFYRPNANLKAMNTAAVESAGGGQSHDNMQPYLVLNLCIALQGIYPSRA